MSSDMNDREDVYQDDQMCGDDGYQFGGDDNYQMEDQMCDDDGYQMGGDDGYQNDQMCDGEYIIDNVDVDPEEAYHCEPIDNPNEPEVEPQPKKRRGLPKTMLANQQKYLDALEKQQKMMNAKKNKEKAIPKAKTGEPHNAKPIVSAIPPGMRRVIVAGKVKYIPINVDKGDVDKVNKVNNIDTVEKIDKLLNPPVTTAPVVKLLAKPSDTITKTIINESAIINDLADVKSVKPIKSTQSNKPVKSTQSIKPKSTSTSTQRRIPGKYAKEIEKDVKRQTEKNVKNFTDLRRIRALQDIAPDADIDTNRASIIELRKLRIEQRKKDQAEQKKRAEANKKESAIQEILNNDKMTKFGKALAIKNLSVNSRHKKAVTNKQNNLM